jgi:hypothetical protein
MAELNDHVACNTAIENLTGLQLFGSKLEFGYVLLQFKVL